MAGIPRLRILALAFDSGSECVTNGDWNLVTLSPCLRAPHSRVRYLAFARHRRVPLAARRLRPKATPTFLK